MRPALPAALLALTLAGCAIAPVHPTVKVRAKVGDPRVEMVRAEHREVPNVLDQGWAKWSCNGTD